MPNNVCDAKMSSAMPKRHLRCQEAICDAKMSSTIRRCYLLCQNVICDAPKNIFCIAKNVICDAKLSSTMPARGRLSYICAACGGCLFFLFWLFVGAVRFLIANGGCTESWLANVIIICSLKFPVWNCLRLVIGCGGRSWEMRSAPSAACPPPTRKKAALTLLEQAGTYEYELPAGLGKGSGCNAGGGGGKKGAGEQPPVCLVTVCTHTYAPSMEPQCLGFFHVGSSVGPEKIRSTHV